MTTIILTIIGILLAAAAALMVIFYGGDAFNSSSTAADAVTVQNAGANVIAAIHLVKAETGSNPQIAAANDAERFTAFAAMSGVNGRYLKDAPTLPAGYVQNLDLAGKVYTVFGVADDVCARINVNLKVSGATWMSSPTYAKAFCKPAKVPGGPTVPGGGASFFLTA